MHGQHHKAERVKLHMDHGFWHERWTVNQIGFHQGSSNRFLEQYWPGLQLATGSRVLVPLCGKSLDLLWLRDQGHRVTGIELSPLAVEAFFAEHALTPAVRQETGYSRWSAENIELYCADLFTLSQVTLGHFEACYDRAALIALPAPMRRQYAQHLRKLLPPRTPGLLVTLEYPPAEMNGPPFAVTGDELQQLFGSDSQLRQLESSDTLPENPSFRDRGLTTLQEAAWYLEYV